MDGSVVFIHLLFVEKGNDLLHWVVLQSYLKEGVEHAFLHEPVDDIQGLVTDQWSVSLSNWSIMRVAK